MTSGAGTPQSLAPGEKRQARVIAPEHVTSPFRGGVSSYNSNPQAVQSPPTPAMIIPQSNTGVRASLQKLTQDQRENIRPME